MLQIVLSALVLLILSESGAAFLGFWRLRKMEGSLARGIAILFLAITLADLGEIATIQFRPRFAQTPSAAYYEWAIGFRVVRALAVWALVMRINRSI